MARKPSYEELKQRVKELERRESGRRQVEDALRERVKELNCLYSISRLIESGKGLAETLQETANLIPESWQFPEVTTAQIRLQDDVFNSGKGCEKSCGDCSHDFMRQNIVMDGHVCGEIRVCYHETMPRADEGPFLKEERDLLNAIAERLGRMAERKHAEDSLKQTILRLEEAAKAGNVGLWNWDLITNEVQYSTQWKRQIGYEAHEISNDFEEWKSRVHPDDLESTLEEIQKSIAECRNDHQVEFRFRHRDGSYRWIVAKASIFEDEAGRPVRMLGSHTDITDQKRAEDELRFAKDRAQQYLDVAGVMLIALDVDGNVTLINEKGCEILGCREDEIVGRNWFDEFLASEDITEIKQVFDRIISGDIAPVEYYENPVVRKGGTKRLIAWHNSVVRGSSGEIVGLLSSGNDITDQRQMERELKQHSRLQERLLDTLPNPVFYKDKEGKYIGCNRAFEEFLGKPREEIVGKTVYDMAPKNIADKYAEKDEELFRSPGTQSYEWAVRTKDGQFREVIFDKATFLDAEDKVGGLIGIITDITTRKQTERALRKSQKRLEEAMDLALMANWEFDVASETFTFDDRFYALCGTTAEVEGGYQMPVEVYAKEFIHPEEQHTVFEEVRKVIEATDPLYESHLENRIVRRDGKIRHIVVSYKIKKDESGNTTEAYGVVQDITERKNAEATLWETEATLQAAMDNSPAGIAIANAPDGKLRYVNDAALDIRGKAKQEVVDNVGVDKYVASWEILHFDGTPFAEDEVPLARAIKYGETCNEQFIIRRPNNEDRVVWAHAAPILDGKGNVKSAIVVFPDITEQKMAEEAIRKEKKISEGLIASMHDGFTELDIDGVHLNVNPAFCKMTGFSKEELLGVGPPHPYWPSTERKNIENAFKRTPEGDSGEHELTFVKKTGEEFQVLVSPSWLEDEDGNLIRVFATVKDLTELRSVQRREKEALERLRLAMESAEEGFWEWDFETGLVTFDEVALGMLGYQQSKEPETGKWWISQIHPEDRPYVEEAFGDFISGRAERYDIEFRLKKKDGGYLWIASDARIIRSDEKGNPLLVVGIHRDITDEKRAEEEKQRLESQLRQAQKMEAIGSLAGGIAHDFNNVLGIIIGNLELAADDLPEGNPARLSLSEAEKGCLRAKDMVKQILAFSRQQEKTFQPIDIQPIVKEAVKMLRSSIPTTIELHQDIATKNAFVSGDPTQIHQILMNLCTNAVDAMDEMGSVLKVGLDSVELDADRVKDLQDLEPGQYIRLTVSDTGKGMAPDIMEKIFDPYFTTKDVGRGTGMGLSVVHGIVKEHRGSVTVDSEPGKGTTFQVYFPEVESEVDGYAESVETLPLGSETVLFVDDEAPLADLGQRILEGLEYNVESRTSSIEALEAFRADPDKFDLVITDMTMPNMTGETLAKELIELRPDIPIIMCTGFSHKIDEEKAKSIGIRDFVLKPLVKSELANTVRSVLDVRRHDLSTKSTPQ